MKLPMRNIFCVVSCCAAALAGFAGESLTAASPGADAVRNIADSDCGQAAIRFDDAICGNLVYGNRFENCAVGKFGGVQINGGRGNVIRNNLFTVRSLR